MAKRTLHIIITILLLFSITDINRISLLVAASFADNDCSALFCTCSGSRSCSAGTHAGTTDKDVNAAGIPILIPQADNESGSSCCTKKEGEKTTEQAQPASQPSGVNICSCGHESPSEADFLLKPLDKVTLFPQAHLSRFTTPRPMNPGQKYKALAAHTDEVFHPPSGSVFGLTA